MGKLKLQYKCILAAIESSVTVSVSTILINVFKFSGPRVTGLQCKSWELLSLAVYNSVNYDLKYITYINLPPSMSLAIRAMSNAFPQELRLIKDIISGQYLFWKRINLLLVTVLFSYEWKSIKVHGH